MAKKKKQEAEVIGFLGVGFDNHDEHKRITRSESFLLVGGSEQTHEKMQETAIRFDESLKKSGKTLRETPSQEVADLLREAIDRCR